jgi:hypothetical protein
MKQINKIFKIKNLLQSLMMLLVASLIIGTSACHSSRESSNEHGNREKSEKNEAKGEHNEGGESAEKGHDEGGEEGEEDGSQFRIDETYEGVRNGVHMALAYDSKEDAFIGVVKNITQEVVPQVRVEVHLSNKVELGPTPRADLAPGESRKIILKAEGNTFDSWSTHAESGKEEGHGSEGSEGKEGGESHSEREKGEHR